MPHQAELRRLANAQRAEIEQLQADAERWQGAFAFITNWHDMKSRNRLNPAGERTAHKESWERCLAKAKEVRGE